MVCVSVLTPAGLTTAPADNTAGNRLSPVVSDNDGMPDISAPHVTPCSPHCADQRAVVCAAPVARDAVVRRGVGVGAHCLSPVVCVPPGADPPAVSRVSARQQRLLGDYSVRHNLLRLSNRQGGNGSSPRVVALI